MINVSTHNPFIENPQQMGIPPLCLSATKPIKRDKLPHRTFYKIKASIRTISCPITTLRTEHTHSQRKRDIKYP